MSPQTGSFPRRAATASTVRGTPTIALLYPGRREVGAEGCIDEADSEILPFSLDPSLQITGAVCLGTTLSIPATVAWRLIQRRTQSSGLLKRPSGLMDVEAKLETHENGETSVGSVSVFRTAR